MNPSGIRPLRIVVFPVLAAALLTGNCTDTAQGEVSAWAPFAAAVLAGALVLATGAALLLAGSRLSIDVWSLVAASTLAGMLLAVHADAGSDSVGGFFLMLALVAIASSVFFGYFFGQRLTPGKGVIMGVVVALTVFVGQGLLVWAYLLSADVCIAVMGNTCSNLDPIKWAQFAAMVALFPSAVALIPALVASFIGRSKGPVHAKGEPSE